jgi:hypothetical protein
LSIKKVPYITYNVVKILKATNTCLALRIYRKIIIFPYFKTPYPTYYNAGIEVLNSKVVGLAPGWLGGNPGVL